MMGKFNLIVKMAAGQQAKAGFGYRAGIHDVHGKGDKIELQIKPKKFYATLLSRRHADSSTADMFVEISSISRSLSLKGDN